MALAGLVDGLRGTPGYEALLRALAGAQPTGATVPDAAKPFVLSGLWRHAGRPVLVVCPRPDDARRLVEQMEAYLGEDAPLFHLTESEVLPYERLAVDAATVHARIGALAALRGSLTGPAPLVVASAMALQQRTFGGALLDAHVHVVTVGQKLALDPLLEHWARMGYRVAPMVEAPGMASRRGGIVDVFSPGHPQPVRIELWGDRVDSIRRFDVRTQRSTGQLREVTVLPAAEVLPRLMAEPDVDRMVRALDFSSCKTAERDRFHDGFAELVSGLSPELATFYAGFFLHHTVLDLLPADGAAILFVVEPAEVQEAARHEDAEAARLRFAKEERGELPAGFPQALAGWEELAAGLGSTARRVDVTRYHTPGDGTVELPFAPPPAYVGSIQRLAADVRQAPGGRVVIATQHSQRIEEMLRGQDVGVRETRALEALPAQGTVHVVHGAVAAGWMLGDGEGAGPARLTLLTDTELFGTAKRRLQRGRTRTARTNEGRVMAVEELEPGQFVVHIEHGIGRFVGTTTMQAGPADAPREYLVLEYADADKLYVPMEHLDRLSPYVGTEEETPAPTRLGTQEWTRLVTRAKESTKRLAVDLLAIYAQREAADGHAFPPDTPWQREMEDAFPYVETADQAAAIAQVKDDMEHGKPMDRLVSGDVGYGKTEVALRAAFKAVMDGKQVAVLVPTTVLAQQHYATFAERLQPFPVRIEVLSRFRTAKEQDDVVARLKRGEVDIVIGTHRLVQKDVDFRDLGLVVIDEEHRFGVNHKERLRDLRRQVDVLTMTATPIPRTLYMTLSGVRDVSNIDTPPEDRLPIKTFLAEASDDVMREAILREMDRGGQVYFLHNRVKSIDLAAAHVKELVPDARVLTAHGQMPEELLEKTMAEFGEGAADVLVCTTIIESGLDIPTVNTLIVDRADRLGLAQLYQLRGRIGRRGMRGYAYLLVQRGRKLTDVAQRRLQTIVAAAELGAGFRVAMKDLEIRGAGNILGAEQSGHIHAVGFELYTRLLAQAVADLRASGGATEAADAGAPDPQLDLGLPASIPESLAQHMPTRLALYQRLARARTAQDVDDITRELRDRYGQRLPEELYNLLFGVRVRVLARVARVEAVTRAGGQVTLRLRDEVGGARVPLERALGNGARVGNQQIHVPAGEGDPWGQVLLEVLTRLEAFRRRLPAPSLAERAASAPVG